MSENMRGTLTSSGSGSVHTSTFIILLYQPCIMAISEYSGPSCLENYAHVAAFESNLQRASFHSVIDFLSHSIIAKLLSLYNHQRSLIRASESRYNDGKSLSVLFSLWRASSCRVATPIGTFNRSDR